MKRLLALAGAVLLTGVLSASAWLGLSATINQKAVAAGTNLITNPSLEDGTDGAPTAWKKEKWGTNTAVFAAEAAGHTGKAVSVTMSARTSGDARWQPNAITVKPSTAYTFSDWYQGTVTTDMIIAVTSTTGQVTYKWLGAPSASATWRQASYIFTTPADAKTIVPYHYLQYNGKLTTDDYSLIENTAAPTPTPPTVQLTAPANAATVSGTQAVTANATDAQGIKNVQFKVDGTNVGAPDTTAPYSIDWDTKSVANGTHTITAVATNTADLTATATGVSVTVNNPTAPTIQITAPTAGATVSGLQSVTAAVTSGTAVTNVQFKLDGAAAATDPTAPYVMDWDTTKVTNGTHVIEATVTNAANLTATASVTVNVQNQVTPPPVPTPTNLISNPSLETANGAAPAGWLPINWGTNTALLSYLNTGRTGSRSVKAEITAYTNGAANWYYTGVPVTPGKTYQYTGWYQSNVDTEVDVEVTMTNGTVQYYYLTSAFANANWTKVSGTFVAPTGAKSMTIYHIIAKKGYLVTDDYSLAEYAPAKFSRPLVSLTFDDGWRSIYSNGLPVLTKYGLASTQYLLTSTTDYPDYMTVAMMQEFKNKGHEIASHTNSHAHLTQLTPAQLTAELTTSQSLLRQWLGADTAKNFATPYGEYNTAVVTEIQRYYRSHRSTDTGYNSKDNFNVYNIKVQNILNTTTPEQVRDWVNQAIATNTWLVLVYHDVAAVPSEYGVTPANLDKQLSYVKQSGAAVVTVDQALNELLPQL